MKKTYQIASDFIDKDKQTSGWNYYVIRLTLDKTNFEKRFITISNFTKALMNGKNKLSEVLGTNRSFFNKLKPINGFYKVFDFLHAYELVWYLETPVKINETELRYRIRKLVPSSVITIYENDDSYMQTNKEAIMYDTSLELIGSAKKSLTKL